MTTSDSPDPKISGYVQTARNYLLSGPSYGPFCPKFRCHGNGDQSGVNINDTVELADPKIMRTTKNYDSILYIAGVMMV